ncbi:hypothetical protein LX16_4098 [Stackebrandtia albiflava]|uniref:PPE family protein n=1 Tax=Stackebrandtia albiflava TaxID=406432 RepID=A0A562UYP3_9ACTN|nr:hypothetical protein [Stackebrandtia albiflava]TWJ10678.1 hypothetical protein LX16_4098 [Stackebrandtia albiflava]
MGEYDGYTIDEIMDMIKNDSIPDMENQAQGWANAAAVFQTEYDAIDANYQTIKGMWTSESSQPYRSTIERTLMVIREAKVHAERKAAAWANVAGNTQRAYDAVKTKYDEWQEAKQFGQAMVVSPAGFAETLANELLIGAPTEFDENAARQPFDRAVREIMNSAALYAEEQSRDITRPVPEYKPVEPPPSWDDPGYEGPTPLDYGSFASQAPALVATGPSLQGGGPAPVTPGLPIHTGPTTPVAQTPFAPTGPPGLPPGGMPPLAKSPTPPALKPPSPTSGPNSVKPNGPHAPRTPGLPQQRTPVSPRTGTPPPRTGPTGRTSPNATPRTGATGRNGPVKSQMAPVDRRNSVRSANQVIGQRPTGKQSAPQAKPTGTPTRRVQPPVIGTRGGKSGRNEDPAKTRRTRADRTGQGYTRSVLGSKARRNEKDGEEKFSRTPVVPPPIETVGLVIGARSLAAAESDRERRLEQRRARRKKLRMGGDEVNRAVIGNGISHRAQLPDAEPTKLAPVKAEDAYWQTETQVVSGVLGARRPRPEVVHDPGPGTVTGSPGVEEPTETPHTAGPVAFKNRTSAPDHGW